jgi:hypothetical protein
MLTEETFECKCGTSHKFGTLWCHHCGADLDETKDPNLPRRIQEAVADIAYIAGGRGYYSGDSRQDIADFIKWAEEFERLYKLDALGNETYNGKDYMTAVEEFTNAKLETHRDLCKQ